ncbi:hypothetical protein OH799_18210 [Nocardia sp. NBC_00881]|uniref:hypothetical protein n=1 Tax=Nocardia sp. NBC_00881 TaxID=2975995 RepID=UPI0038681F14|nr:hypothetical protein OH799_18210 [Nocardia sp. NBC_00881]
MSELETDVLVLGGGPAGTWAAVSAAAAGAGVVLADKARCGSSGPTAFGTTSLWNIPPGLRGTRRCNGGTRTVAGSGIRSGCIAYAALDDIPDALRNRLIRQQVVDRTGRVPLQAVLEGTVRGTGGLRMTGPDCATTVAGLYAAGDVTSREPITGAISGFGGQGGAWAVASGVWAGAAAAKFARTAERRAPAREMPGAGLNAVARIDPEAVVGLVQEHTLPLRRSYWRSAGSLRDSIGELDAMWPGAEFDLGGSGVDRLHARAGRRTARGGAVHQRQRADADREPRHAPPHGATAHWASGCAVRVSAHPGQFRGLYRGVMARDTAQGIPGLATSLSGWQNVRIPYLCHRRVRELRRSPPRDTPSRREVHAACSVRTTRPVLAPRSSAVTRHRDIGEPCSFCSQPPRNVPVSAFDERSESTYTYYPVVTVPRFSPTRAGVKSCHL